MVLTDFKAGMGHMVQKMKYRGELDFSGFLNMIRAYFVTREYEYFETRYKEKPSIHGKEIEINLYAERKITPYVKHRVDIFMHLWDIQPKDIEVGGVKKRIISGRLSATFEPSVQTDWQKKFTNNEIERKLDDFLRNQIMDKELDFMHIDRLYYELFQLTTQLKQHLGMLTSDVAY